MVRLTLLGGLHLEDESGPLTGRAAQKRRLALLAVLASSEGRPVARERLLGWLWPEVDDERARHSLSGALSDLRKELGDDLFDTRGDAVALQPGVLVSDVAEFTAAVKGNRPELAVELYQGPFLDGFFLPDAVEFEHWVDSERQRYAAEYIRALELLAERAAERGDARGAVDAWRRLATADPFSSRMALGYIRALDSAGDRATALRFAKVHASLLREELETEPDPEVLELVRRLREEPRTESLVPPVGPSRSLERPPDEAPAAGAPPAPPAPPAAIAGEEPAPRSGSRGMFDGRRRMVALAVVGVLLVSGILLSRAPADEQIGVAVLPFENLEGSPETNYFADGLTEEILNALAKVESLRVPARTTAFAYRGRGTDVREVGRQLGVRYVVGGTVRRAGDRVRISAWLVDASSGYELWSEGYDRLMGAVFDTEEEIARSIAGALRPRLAGELPTLVRTATRDPDAYNEYLRGRALWYARTPDGLRRALIHFQQALRHDSTYGLAHAGIADVYNTLGAMEWGALPPREAFSRSGDAAERALALDPTIPEAHAALATAMFNYHWDWARADASYQRALEINPGYVMARHWYSLLLLAADRPEDALAQILTAREMDPRSAIISSSLARHYYYRRDLEGSIREYREAIGLDSTMALPYVGLGMAAAAHGDARLALDTYREAERVLGQRSSVLRGLTAHAYGLAGERQRARALYEELRAERTSRYVPAHVLALAALGSGRHQEAMQWLEDAFVERSPAVIYARTDPIMDPLRGDANFRRLMSRVERAIEGGSYQPSSARPSYSSFTPSTPRTEPPRSPRTAGARVPSRAPGSGRTP